MSENKDLPKPTEEKEDDPDGYIRTIASTWGHVDLIKEWLPHHQGDPAKITDNVLIPAAMYGQLEILKMAIEYGDVMRKDQSSTYPGWSLMHFAVEGAQRNLPLTAVDESHSNAVSQDIIITNDMNPPSPRTLTPKSVQDIHYTQLDIIYLLEKAGADPAAVDNKGLSASYRACKQLETYFLEGSILIDILATLRSERLGTSEKLITPGLSSIPGAPYWKKTIFGLMQWAYLRGHYEILQFCQEKKYASLYSEQLLVKSNISTLRQTKKPLMIAAIHEENYDLIEAVLNISNTPLNVLSKEYEYNYGHTKKKESVISYACSSYADGKRDVIGRLLMVDMQNKFLTHVTLSGIGLRRLPSVIMHENLTVFDARDNNLDDFPTESSDPNVLGWKCAKLKTLNLSSNLFAYIHPGIFHLPSLTRLVMSRNQIQNVPMNVWMAPLLKDLDLSDNLIANLPCPKPVSATPLPLFSSVSINPRHGTLKRKGVETGNYLQSLRRSYVSYDVRSSNELHKSQIGFALHMLDLSGNRLSSIPNGLPCLAPLLHTLKLARNAITNLSSIADFPPLLQTLDLSSNGVTQGIQPSSKMNDIYCIQSQLVKGKTSCSHFDHESLSSLKFLYLCDNRIEDLKIEYQKPELELSQTYSVNQSLAAVDNTPELLYPKLQGLKISNNSLVRFPENIHRLTSLRELILSGNTQITEIPPCLHKLTFLFTFRYDGINDPVVKELAHFKNTAEVLYYLKAREIKSCSNTSMRLFVIGHYSKGKTTILKYLRGSTTRNTFDFRTMRLGSDLKTLAPEEKESTVGIDCGKWVCTPLKRTPADVTPINFYTWDFAGQEEYYVTHQCFLTNRALYLLVWNVLDGDQGIESLSIWLQNLQARAQGSPHTVIVVGTHVDLIPKAEREKKCRIWKDKLEEYRIGRSMSRGFPNIVSVHFVGCPPKGRGAINIDTLNDLIYNTAISMESPTDRENWIYAIGLKIKTLNEQIPQSYDDLRCFIEELAVRTHGACKPAISKKEFCKMVSHIIEGETEVETAVDYLHATTGVILHFSIPVIKDYYIIDPQKWFDLCALVISPGNVSSLVRVGRPGDERFGLLSSAKMTSEFTKQGCDNSISELIRTFLSQLSIIHEVNREYCLVPSAIDPEPILNHKEEEGFFPRHQAYQVDQQNSSSSLSQLPSIGPLVSRSSASGNLKVCKTGLIYRRMLLIPPMASGFWSRLIALCLQKQDFQQILASTISSECKPAGPAHRLRSMIGNLELNWIYWKTGIILYISEIAVLKIHSLRSHEFEMHNDKAANLFQSRVDKIKHFSVEGSDGWTFIPPHFKEVIEVIVPEISVIRDDQPPANPSRIAPTSGRILVKALEIVDEVLKSHCEHFAITGIYSLNDMIHIIPCPIHYGDNDERYFPDLEDESYYTNSLTVEDEVPQKKDVSLPKDCICVFTIDACIRQTFKSSVIECPRCGPLELEYLAPDLVFADVSEFKVDKTQLSHPVTRDEAPNAKGSFGIVFRRTLHTKNEGDLDVAVKLFDQNESALPQDQVELTRSYSDMRYELNKLSSLHHPHIIRFIGIITNPHCFVLEWAPLQSLEHQRAEHARASACICVTSILHVLLQVTSALSYLHSPHEVGIVHRDLKCSNVLVFKFPVAGHQCWSREEQDNPVREKQDQCHVLVKLTDMGICANPLATRAKGTGLRMLIPECISADSTRLTEKVDIFSLGSCLYEMMTLRNLPPENIGEPEYRQMLLAGKRPQFYALDTPYPPLLFQLLEECWHQEHYLRPSAEQLFNTITEITRFNTNPTPDPSPDPRSSVLLDSFTLHQVNRVTAADCLEVDSGFEMCAALSGRDGRTAVVEVRYDNTCDKSELQVEPIKTIKNTEVVSLQMTPASDIIVGCADGTILFYNAKREKISLTLESPCCMIDHGDIIRVHYNSESQLMVVAFEISQVHIKRCVEEPSSCSKWIETCLSLLENQYAITDMKCTLLDKESDCPMFEIWFSMESDEIETWSVPISSTQTWTPDTFSQIRRVSRIKVSSLSAEVAVRRMETSCDGSMMVAVVETGEIRGIEVAIIDIKSKRHLRLFNVHHSVSSILLTPQTLALGTYEGEIYMYNASSLFEPQSTPHQPTITILHHHCNNVYFLHLLKGKIGTNGLTSPFPTFVGRATEEIERDLLISIGFGRGYPAVKKHRVFKKSSNSKGCYVNTWMI